MQITDVMKTEVVTVEKGTAIMAAIDKMVRHNITGLPVVDDKHHVIGIITEKDVLAMAIRIYEKSYVSDQTSLKVEDFMTQPAVTLEATESFTALCSALIKNTFRRIPVVLNNKLVGIVSRKDVISCILLIEG